MTGLTHETFQALRNDLLASRPGTLDLAETNLYAALRRLAAPAAPRPPPPHHPGHLASAWLAHFGLEETLSPRAMVTGGVRHALATLFAHAKAQQAELWLPRDNYPVYGVLAAAAGITPRTFPTLPEPVFPSAPPTGRPEYLLVTHPMKPLGRWLSDAEADNLIAWSRAHADRRIVIDAVYTFESRLHAATLRLFRDGRTILLHSLTKGWLEPRLFGIALLADGDPALRERFRHAPPEQANLARATDLLARHARLPDAVGAALRASRVRLVERLPPQLGAGLVDAAPGYLATCAVDWRAALEEHGVLGLPAEVFGSTAEGQTIFSSLSLA